MTFKTKTAQSFSYPVVRTLADEQQIFSGLCGFSGAIFNVGPPDAVERTTGAQVSASTGATRVRSARRRAAGSSRHTSRYKSGPDTFPIHPSLIETQAAERHEDVDPEIEVLGPSRFCIEHDGIAAHDEESNLVSGENRQQIFEM